MADHYLVLGVVGDPIVYHAHPPVLPLSQTVPMSSLKACGKQLMAYYRKEQAKNSTLDLTKEISTINAAYRLLVDDQDPDESRAHYDEKHQYYLERIRLWLADNKRQGLDIPFNTSSDKLAMHSYTQCQTVLRELQAMSKQQLNLQFQGNEPLFTVILLVSFIIITDVLLYFLPRSLQPFYEQLVFDIQSDVGHGRTIDDLQYVYLFLCSLCTYQIEKGDWRFHYRAKRVDICEECWKDDKGKLTAYLNQLKVDKTVFSRRPCM